MSRWEHTVVVKADVRSIPYLHCSCGWVSHGFIDPAVSYLVEKAQGHRRWAAKGYPQHVEIRPRQQVQP